MLTTKEKETILRSQVCFMLLNKYTNAETSQSILKYMVLEPEFQTGSHKSLEGLVATHALESKYDYFDIWIAASMLKVDIYLEVRSSFD